MTTKNWLGPLIIVFLILTVVLNAGCIQNDNGMNIYDCATLLLPQMGYTVLGHRCVSYRPCMHNTIPVFTIGIQSFGGKRKPMRILIL